MQTDEEYRAQYSCVKNPFGSRGLGHDKPPSHSLRKRRHSRSDIRTYQPPLNASLHLPDIVDWHTKGAVTSIKTQVYMLGCGMVFYKVNLRATFNMHNDKQSFWTFNHSVSLHVALAHIYSRVDVQSC